MKYIKSFNESYLDKDFVETSLIELMDKGYEIIFKEGDMITIGVNASSEVVYWRDIKDYFVPLVEVLEQEYRIVYMCIATWDSGEFYYDKSKELDVNIEQIYDSEFRYFEMVIKKKQ